MTFLFASMFSSLDSLLGKNFEIINATIFEKVVEYLLSYEGEVTRQVSVDDRGDGCKGRVDLVLQTPTQKIGIEIDRKSPRMKSMEKLRGFSCDKRFVFTRSPFRILEI